MTCLSKLGVESEFQWIKPGILFDLTPAAAGPLGRRNINTLRSNNPIRELRVFDPPGAAPETPRFGRLAGRHVLLNGPQIVEITTFVRLQHVLEVHAAVAAFEVGFGRTPRLQSAFDLSIRYH